LEGKIATASRPIAVQSFYGEAGKKDRHAKRFLLGIVPVWTDAPPIMVVRSMTATRLRAFAVAIAHFWPGGPLPTTTRSYSSAFTLRTPSHESEASAFIAGYVGSGSL
jgi:hypothetical protein